MIKVYIDGASAGNPGPSGAGIFIKDEEGKVQQYSVPLEEMSNHEAEFHALIKALEICQEKGYSYLSFHTDSQAIERAIEKRFAKKQYEPLLREALAFIDSFQLFFIKWIPSKQNHMADELARKAIHKKDN